MNQDELGDRLAALDQKVALIEAYFSDAFWAALDAAYDATLQHRSICCIVCGKTGLRDTFDILLDRCIFGGGRLERYRCPQCDCIFGPQKYLDLSESFVARDYQLLYSRYSEGNSTANEIRTFESLSPISGRLYLDWGCGGIWNEAIRKLRDDKWEVWGYEPNAAVASGFVVNRRDQISARFDGIFSNNVIEHFRDPIAQFKDFHTILKVGGAMAHSSPCYEYAYSYTRFHTLFLLGRSPYVLAERTGFKIANRIQEGEYINYVYMRN